MAEEHRTDERREPSVAATTDGDRPLRLTRPQRRAVFAAALGNAVEFYDWAVYGTFVAIFSPQFFAGDSGIVGLLSALAVFAVGFVARPVGAIVLGSYADRVGRRKALILAIAITSLGALAIAVVPSYAVIGIAAPIVLVVARLAQGFAAGGESTGSMTYLAEMAPQGRRGFIGSFQQVSTAVGLLAASLMGALLTGLLPAEQLNDWGWRIAFFVAAGLGVVTLILRRSAEETEAFQKIEAEMATKSRPSAIEAFRKNPKQMLQVFGLNLPAAIVNYLWLVYMPTLASTISDIPLSQALAANTIALSLSLVILPLCGKFSDRFGRRPNLFIFNIGFVVFSFPALQFLGINFVSLLVVQIIGTTLMAFAGSILASQYNELFPAETRAAGTAIPYALSVAIFGGTAPFLVTWMFANGLSDFIWVYVALAAVIGLVTTLTLRETSRRKM